MSISADVSRTLRHSGGNLLAALFTALFGGIYEYFSHNVMSYYMVYAFALPMLSGIFLLYSAIRGKKQPDRRTLNILNSATATLTVGNVFQGVLEIFGTTHILWFIYPTVGGLLLIAANVSFLTQKPKKEN